MIVVETFSYDSRKRAFTDRGLLVVFGALTAVPYATNPAPAQLTMPDLSQDQGGWGSGASATNATFYVMVWEEWASCDVSLLPIATSLMTSRIDACFFSMIRGHSERESVSL